MLRYVFLNRAYYLPRELTGDVGQVIDLGAHIGLSTLYFADYYREARIVAVEPDPGNFVCLRRNIDGIANRSRVSTVHACIAGAKGTVQFSTDGPSWGRSIMNGTGTGIDVPCLSLGDLLEQFNLEKVDIVKMDIEGAEKLVFRSVEEWIDRVGWILMDLHLEAMSFDELRDALARTGRRTFVRVNNPYCRWIEVTDSKVLGKMGETGSLELVIPPDRSADRLSNSSVCA